MKIGIDARVLMNEKYSGVSRYAFDLLSALFASDKKNEYVLFYNSRKAVKLPEFDFPNVAYRGFHWPNKIFNLFLNFFGWPKLDKLIGGCDIFFAPNLHFVAWSDQCRKAVAVHDLSFLAYPDFFTLKSRLWHKLILSKKILAQADAIMADSESTKRDLVELLKIPPEKIKVVYLGANIQAGKIAKEEILQKYNLPEKYFLFVATIEPRKNLAGAIEALKKLPGDVKLAVAGDWGWKCGQTKKTIKQENDKTNNVIFLGYVDESDKAALYQNAVALVYPSFYEGFGLPIAEAMALGCPVICGNNSSQGEVLGDAGLLVDPFNVSEIKQAMELMLTDGELRQELIKKGYQQAGKFSWQKTAAEYLGIFENLYKKIPE